MKFSSKTEYGARVMVGLAHHYGQGPLSLTDIARDEDLPLPYLEHIIAPLRKAGLVISRFGARGGYELARAPQDISMRDVLQAIDGPISPMICATAGDRVEVCVREDFCGTRILWVRIRDSITAALEATSLAELCAPSSVVERRAMFQSLPHLAQLPSSTCVDATIVPVAPARR